MTKKQILKGIIFIALVLWLLVHLTYVIRTNGDVKDRFVGFYAEKKNTIDAVVIGSSPVYPCLITPKLYEDMGITMYPISSNMQRPVSTKYLVDEVLKTQDPELLIFEMRMWTAEDEDLKKNTAHTREVTDNLKYSVNRIKTINAMVDEPSERLSYYFDIFKYHSNWKTMFLADQLKTAFYSYPDDLKGFVAMTTVGPVEDSGESDTLEVTGMPDLSEEYYFELMDYLKEINREALFVILPYKVSEKDQKSINYMEKVAEERGFLFLDMNKYKDEIGIDFERDFRDYGTHTNVLGAEKVTDFFEDYLRDNYISNGILAGDHRGDEKYKSWDKAAALWEASKTGWEQEVETNIENKIWYDIETDE